MALLSKVTYEAKENVNLVVVRKNQATAEDFNELKTIVNAAIDDLNWIKSDEFNIEAGTTPIPFNDPFPDGVPYAVVVLACNNSKGYYVANKIGNRLRGSFDLTVSEACVGIYLAIRKR